MNQNDQPVLKNDEWSITLMRTTPFLRNLFRPKTFEFAAYGVFHTETMMNYYVGFNFPEGLKKALSKQGVEFTLEEIKACMMASGLPELPEFPPENVSLLSGEKDTQ